MRFSRTIGFRIALGFGILILAIIASAYLSYRLAARTQAAQDELYNTLEPGILGLIEFKSTIHEARDLVLSWDGSGRDAGSPLPDELAGVLQTGLQESRMEIVRLAEGWNSRERDAWSEIDRYINDSIYPNTMRFSGRSLVSYRNTGDSLQEEVTLNDLMASYDKADRELENLIEDFNRLETRAGERASETFRKTGSLLLAVSLSITLAALIIAILLYLSLSRPIRQYRESITSMGEGVVPDRQFREGPDELGRIGAALNRMIRNLGELSSFAGEIGKGNFKSELTPLSEKDILGNSLIRLRENLKNASIEEEKRKREDERRNWSNHGIARFSEIMREHSGDLKNLGERLVSELVRYLGAKVGGIFMIRSGGNEDGDIELIASYAYDRTKHLRKIIKPGEGLVGRCVQEGKSIFMTDIPEDYIKIKSGLGEDNPRSLLIVPIRFNERIIGVLEIASLEIFQDFQVEFVERIGTSIASSLYRLQPGGAG
jgi:hypothetical protein